MTQPLVDRGSVNLTPDVTPVSRDAIIYIPGLAKRTNERRNIPMRFVHALDWNAKTASATFSTRAELEATKKLNGLATVTSVLRRDGDVELPVIDVYQFDYHDTLVTFKQRSPIVQAGALAGMLLAVLGRVIAGIGKPSKTRAEKINVAAGVATYLLLSTYMMFLLIVGLIALVDAGSLVVSPNIKTLFGDARERIHALEAAVLAIGSLGLFRTKGLRDLLDTVASELAAAGRYLSTGQRMKTVQGRLADLLARILEVEPKYDRIHVVAFSFGSLVAIDSLFPKQVAGRQWERVDSLVTVGCPFDFIRTYWPEYFGTREGVLDKPRKWYNVFAPADILGSDFTDATYDAKTGKPTTDVGVQLRDGGMRVPEGISYGDSRTLTDLGLWSQLTLQGFKAHASYFDEAESAANCISPIVLKLYEGRPALR